MWMSDQGLVGRCVCCPRHERRRQLAWRPPQTLKRLNRFCTTGNDMGSLQSMERPGQDGCCFSYHFQCTQPFHSTHPTPTPCPATHSPPPHRPPRPPPLSPSLATVATQTVHHPHDPLPHGPHHPPTQTPYHQPCTWCTCTLPPPFPHGCKPAYPTRINSIFHPPRESV
jgi:hypothetical protein